MTYDWANLGNSPKLQAHDELGNWEEKEEADVNESPGDLRFIKTD